MNVIRGKLDPNAFFSDVQQALGHLFRRGAAGRLRLRRRGGVPQADRPDRQGAARPCAAQEVQGGGRGGENHRSARQAPQPACSASSATRSPTATWWVVSGGQRSLWLRVDKKTMEALDLVGELCIEHEAAPWTTSSAAWCGPSPRASWPRRSRRSSPRPAAVALPGTLGVAPTKDHLAKVAAL